MAPEPAASRPNRPPSWGDALDRAFRQIFLFAGVLLVIALVIWGLVELVVLVAR